MVKIIGGILPRVEVIVIPQNMMATEGEGAVVEYVKAKTADRIRNMNK